MNGAPYASNAAGFLIQTLFGIYILFVMLRFLFQWVRADYYNPLVQFLVKVTNPLLLPLRRFVPGFMGLDMAAVALILVLQIVEIVLLEAVGAYPFILGLRPEGYSLGLFSLLILAVTEILRLLTNVFLWAVIIQAILSWINPDSYHPAIMLLHQLTEPVLRPVRRLLPPVSSIDFSPMVVVIALILLKMLLLDPLWDLGRYLTLT